MKCDQCGWENAERGDYCESCGAALSIKKKRPAWIAIVVDVILLIMFLPFSFCSAALALEGFRQSAPQDRGYEYHFLIFSVPCLLLGLTVIVLVILSLLKRRR